MKLSANLRGALLGLTAFAIFAAHDVVVKYLGSNYSPFQIVFFSVLFGFPFVTLLLLRDKTEANLIPNHPWLSLLRTAAAVVTGFCAFYAFTVLPLAQVYAILFTTPLLITLLSIPFLGERVGWRRGLAVVLGLCGVIVVLQPGQTELSLGHIAALVAAFGASITSTVLRKIGRDERQVVLILYPMMANFLVMGSVLPFVYQPMPAIDLLAFAAIAACALLGASCLILAYRLATAVTVAPMQYSQIIWASFYGIWLFDETLTTPTIIGTAIIITSGVFILFREGRSGTSTNTPVLRSRSRPGTPGAPRISTFLSGDARGPQSRRPKPDEE